MDLALFQYDMDVEIHNSRILSILDQTIKRVKFVVRRFWRSHYNFLILIVQSVLSAIAEDKLMGLVPEDLKNQLIRICERFEKKWFYFSG